MEGFGHQFWRLGHRRRVGRVDDNDSLAALHAALDLGVNFFDTADVYGDGRSERLLARLRQERNEPFYIATKAGRRLDRHERRRLQPRKPDRLCRTQPQESGHRRHRPAATALPAHGGLLPCRRFSACWTTW